LRRFRDDGAGEIADGRDQIAAQPDVGATAR
jgi:hypothetical protein